ncbi:tyrocidine synthase 3 [Kordia sp. SMS9]|uniref:non-ribosomal peptide synthetase n=1 Tax=Kordia sp. SMS9 TaxID=2282170 RepID=UPI000E0D3137|nr:non-ribosomal peptide synthetase [Kordia sp. SMS9]AXG70214.1 tyrocidine synthase 3 [Kordia sp. SMS9]
MELIKKLIELGVQLREENGELKVAAPKGALTPELINKIRAEKKQLLSLLAHTSHKSIPKAPVQELYPLTSSQGRLWVLSQFEGGGQAYNIPGVLKMEGSLDATALELSFRYLIERHDSLRMYFVEKDGEVYQKILSAKALNFTLDTQQISQEELEAKIASFYQEEFDLSKAPLLSARLLEVSKDQYYLLFAIHHIIGDGWSMEVLTKELMQVYKQLINQEEVTLSKLTIQYQDYVVWSQSQEQQAAIQKQEDYWLEKFTGELPVLALPSYQRRPLVKTYNGSTKHYSFGKELSEKLNQFSKTQGATLYMTLLAGVNGLLYRYTNQNDIIIGAPIAGRSHEALEHQVGLYLNTLAIRTRFEGNNSFKELVETQKATLVEAYTNQDYPFDSLIEKLKLKRDTSRSALFDVMVVLQNQRETAVALEGLHITPYSDIERDVSKFDISFSFTEDTEGIHLRLEYNNDIYDAQLIDQLYHHLEQFITSALEHQEESIQSLTILSQEEETQLLTTFNDTKVAYPKDKTVIDLFREQVAKTPEATAIIDDTEILTYQELEDLSNAMANDLLSNTTIENESLIGVALERSEWLIVSLLAILKTGGAYVPIDPTYPQQRKDYIKHDSQCILTITEEYLSEFKTKEKDTRIPKVAISSDQLAYVIYTSGSTGQPKGVLIEHKSLVNLCFWHKNEYNLNNNSRATLYASMAFDASVWETFPYLCFGGCLFPISDNEIRLNTSRLSAFLGLNKITHCFLSPKVVQELETTSLPKGLKILAGGEALTIQNVEGCELYNNYGPTENTVVASNYSVSKDDNSPVLIGKPIANTHIYILDSYKHTLQPKGVIGELCISGAGLSRGYLHQPELTGEKFISHPFRKGERLYKTGDLARWLPDGNLEFLGRKDTQVKLRGYRIELGEIEYALNQQTDVDATVVVVQEEGQDKYLVAYLVTESAIDSTNLKETLRSYLPEYMIPQYFIKLEALPLTSNGKIDRKALPKVSIEGLEEREYIAPSTETERKLAEIWQEVLGVDKVGITDNFFELGGHSLKITQLINKINKELQSSLTVQQVFVFPTIKGLSKEITTTNYKSIPKAPVQELYPLTSSQGRLWVLSQFEGGGQAYNIPGVLKMEGSLDATALELSFRYLIERHDSLRMYFVEKDGEVYQKILSAKALNFTLDKQQINQEELEAKIASFYQEEFDLSKAPLLSARLLEVSKDQYYLLFAIHHIIGDGWSMEVLTKELMQVYKQLINQEEVTLSKLTIQYQDYVVWSQSQEQQAAIQKQEDYWLEKFTGELPVLALPSYQRRPLVKTYNGSTKHYSFGKELSEKLNQFSKAQGATLYMTLLAGVNGLLYRYTNQSDIIIGAPIAGRSHEALEHQVGLYLNTLAIRTRFEGNNSFKELVETQKETLVEAYTNQDYPFDSLIEKLKLKRDTSRSALFDVMVVLQNQRETAVALEGLHITPYSDIERDVSKFDISFSFTEDTEGIHLRLEYNNDIYDAQLIDQLYHHLAQFITSALEHQEESIQSLTILSQEEETQLLATFNDTKVAYPKDKTVIDLFREQVAKTPEATAIIDDTEILTYQELEDLSNAMANDLLSNTTIENESLIGVALERSEWLIVSLLAILKTGGAYVPIDPTYPQQRKDYIKHDSQCILTITEEYLNEFKTKEKDTRIPKVAISSDQLAYVIYTSGSTGQPKGVLIEHKSLVNYIKNQIAEFEFDASDKIAQFSNPAFDASLEQIFLSLLTGALFVVIPKEELNPTSIVDNYLNKYEITHFHATPSYLQQIPNLHKVTSLKRLISGGEPFNSVLLNGLANEVTAYNKYGPTETTISSTITKIDKQYKGLQIPIGKPVNNVEVYVLSDQLELQPIGVTGELCISGVGLSRGYLNQPELTEEKFITHPFKSGERLYKTGDLVRWLPDGNIDFLGRKDTQVKVRGYRIELGEIEIALVQQEAISQAIVDAVKYKGEQYLVALYTSENEIDREHLTEFLRAYLPEYMIPNYFQRVDELLLTPNGKVDRNSMAKYSIEGLGEREYIAPSTETERKLAEIWQEVLGVDKVGITDNFFELGGHSLKITQLINKINKELQSSLTVQQVFVSPTIKGLSKEITTTNYKSIPKAPVQELYPLTSSQGRLWVLSQFEGGGQAYNIPGVLKMEGSLDATALELSFRYLIERHDSLRMYFVEKDGEVYQKILSAKALNFTLDTQQINQEELEAKIASFYQEEFDLSKAPLLSARLLEVSKDQYYLLFAIHHIIGDGWSMEVLTKELMQVYKQLINQEEVTLSKLTIQYQDYVVWSQSKEQQAAIQKQEDYWLEKFTGELPVLALPSYQRRPLVKTYNGSTKHYSFGKELSEKLNQFSKAQGATLYMTLLAGVNGLLYRYTNQSDIIIGAPIAGRSHEALEHQVGLYLNTLAIRTRFEGNNSFKELVETQKETLVEAYTNQDYPFDSLIEKLKLKRDTSRSALFDVMVVLQNQRETAVALEGLHITPYSDIERDVSKFDISFSFSEDHKGIHVVLEYNTDIYQANQIEDLCSHLKKFLSAGVTNSEETIDSLSILSDEHIKQLITDFGTTQETNAVNVPSMISMFEAQAIATPDIIALEFENQQLTYKELNEKANQFAQYLTHTHKVQPNDFIGVKLDRSAQLIISILGVLKSSAVYIPIDINYPEERISYIIKDSNCKVVVDQQAIEIFDKHEQQFHKENLENKNTPNDLAYIIYTSGTTGQPKGVMIEHGNAIAMLNWAKEEFESDCFEVVYGVTSHCFDLSIYEIFYPLSIGKRLKILPNALAIADEINKDKKVLINTVPSSIRYLLDNGVSLANATVVNLAGEAFPVDIAKRLLSQGLEVRNLYGPTEDTTYSTSYKLSKEEKYEVSIPIGNAINGSAVYILNKELQPVPVGVSGDLYMSGAGVTRGYLNKPSLTQQKYSNDPFKDGARMYNTGDLARWLPDGNLEFLGRKDTQVKLRGYRIELGEIEQKILEYSEEIEQVVLNISNAQDELVAYYVSKINIDKSDLRSYIEKKLPNYMIPSYFMLLDEIPLTPNGKIDKGALPAVHATDIIRHQYEAPSTETERKLVEIWQEVLGVEKVGITDNFFELGGHSLLLMKILNSVYNDLSITITFNEFYQTQNIQTLAGLIDSKTPDVQRKSELTTNKVLASQGQKAIWIECQNKVGLNPYILEHNLILPNTSDINHVKESVFLILQRHESLRTVFVKEKDELFQVIKELDELEDIFYYYNLSQETNKQLYLLQKQSNYDFDLEKGPLIKMQLFHLKDEMILNIKMHHIITDGWSNSILDREFNTIYHDRNRQMKELSFQYKDFSIWQNNYLASDEYTSDKQYWNDRLSKGKLARIRIGTHNPNANKEAGVLSYYFDDNLVKAIEENIKKEQVTLFSFLLSSLSLLLNHYTKEKYLYIGTSIANRNKADFTDVAGFFVNTLVNFVSIEAEKTFKETLFEVNNNLFTDFDHTNYPYTHLIDDFKINKTNPLFNTIIRLVNSSNDQKFPTNEIKDTDVEATKTELSFTFIKTDHNLGLKFSFDKQKHKKKDAIRIIRHFTKLLENITKDISILNKEVDFLFDYEHTAFEFDETMRQQFSHMTSAERFFILDDELNHLPINATGKIFLEVNPDDPLFEASEVLTINKVQKRVIKTDSFAKKQSKSQFSFLGNTDKIYVFDGVRLYTKEIENIVLKHQDIQDCELILDTHNEKLASLLYVVSSTDIAEKSLKNEVNRYFSNLFLSLRIIPVEKIFRDERGNVLKDKLPSTLSIVDTEEKLLPSSEVEIWLTHLFKETLALENISLVDNYFEIGGNSITGMTMASRILEKYDYEIDWSTFYDNPTIANLSQEIEKSNSLKGMTSEATTKPIKKIII